MSPPGVTVVIPCFNYGRFVHEAVESALAQDFAGIGVVIVDDGSTDGTTPGLCDSLASDRVRVIHQPNAGPAAARNRGAREATSEYLVFLDADDTIHPTFISKLVRAIETAAASGVKVSHAYCQEVLTDKAEGTWRVPEWDPTLLMVTNLHPITTVIRRSCFEEVGGFEESLGGNYEDWDLWLRLSFAGYRGVRVTEPLFFWRRHSDDTMVMRAVQAHDQTYARLIERHQSQYSARALDLVRLSNSMLRRFDCNWLDESGFPIPLMWLWKRRDRAWSLEAELAAARRDVDSWKAAFEETRALNAELQIEVIRRATTEARAVRDHYESYTAIRVHRAWHRWMARLPRPLTWLPRQVVKLVRSAF
ncbi:MAG: hypothetical protein AMXMBFR58_22430 [Phycisphaerae bacterium]